MADTWIVDLQHFLAPDGSIGPKSGPARHLAEHFAAIVAEITADIGGETYFAKVRCRRNPKRQPCRTEIESDLNPVTGEIVWCCPKCGDSGVIRNWEDTFWDFSDCAPDQ